MKSAEEITHKLLVERDGELVSQHCERIPLDYAEQQGRGEACMGSTQGGEIYAAVIAAGAGGGELKSSQRLFRSNDGGLSWTSRSIELPGGNELTAFTVLNDDSLLVAEGGNLLGDRSCVRIHRSVDRGETWVQAGMIPAEPFEQIGEGCLSLTQLKDGTILFPVCRWNKVPEGTPNLFAQYVYRSTDDGRTWQGGGELKKGNIAPVGNGPASRWPGMGGTFPGCVETHIVELSDGKLLAVFRYSGDPQPWHRDKVKEWGGSTEPDAIGRFFKHGFLGDSSDGGRTWKNLRPLFDAEGTALLVIGECHGQLVELADGRVVLVHDRRYPYTQSETIGRVSGDGGKTWSRNVYHLSEGTGYAASVALEDGTIVTVAGNTGLDMAARPIEPWSVQAVRWKLE